MKTDELAKSKARASRQYPIDFVVPLQLEECVHRIKRSKTTYYANLAGFDVDIKISSRVDPDRISFSAQFRKTDRHETIQSQKYLIHVGGIMRRWEGTSTKVTGSAHVKRNTAGAYYIDSIEYDLGFSLLVLFIICSSLFAAFLVLVLHISIVVISLFGLVVMGIVMRYLKQNSRPYSHVITTTLKRILTENV